MSIYDYTVKSRNGENFSISEYKGKVLIIVNTATGCGFTPQYEGLERLYKEYHIPKELQEKFKNCHYHFGQCRLRKDFYFLAHTL